MRHIKLLAWQLCKFGIGLLSGCLFFWSAGMVCDDLSCRLWPTTSGEVVGHQCNWSWLGGGSHKFQFGIGDWHEIRIQYAYVTGGNRYYGETTWNIPSITANEALGKWRIEHGDALSTEVGSKVLVYFHPVLPNVSTICPGSCLFEHVVGMVVFGCIGMTVFGWIGAARPLNGSKPEIENLHDELDASAAQYAKCLDDAIASDPTNPHLYVERGTFYSALGQHDKAIGDFSTAISLGPELAEPYRYRSQAYDKLGKRLLARNDIEEAQRLDSANS